MGPPEGEFDRSGYGRRCAERLFRRAWGCHFSQWFCQYRRLYVCIERGIDSAAAEQLEYKWSKRDAVDAGHGHVGNTVCAGAAGTVLRETSGCG
jgi:hypothetical protein